MYLLMIAAYFVVVRIGRIECSGKGTENVEELVQLQYYKMKCMIFRNHVANSNKKLMINDVEIVFEIKFH